MADKAETADPRRIVVGVDGSESSVAALRRAAEIAGALEAPIEAIMTWEYPVMLGAYYPNTTWSPEHDAEKVLARAVERAFGSDLPRRFTHRLLQGAPAPTLIGESADAYMLVLGSRGHGGFVGLMLGSVSAACAAHAHCAVLVVHTPKTPDDSPAPGR